LKITNAIWEQRNIGLNVCEIQFGIGDGETEIGTALGGEEYDYYVAKVPVENISLVHALEERGFRYLENQLNITFTPDEVNRIDKRWIERFSGYSCTLLKSEVEFSNIIKKTDEGLFEKDRFSVDPLIAEGVSDRRIANWIGDIYRRGKSSIYMLKREDEIVGFFIIRNTRKSSVYVEMAAIFSKYRNQGLSFLLIYNILLMSSESGAKEISASVSTNNISTINTFTRFINFRLREVSVVLRKQRIE
jgi:hypothetical protein